MLRRLTSASLLAFLGACTLFQPAVPAPPPSESVTAPAELPRIPAPDPAAAEVPAGYRVEAVLSDLIYPSSVEFDDQGRLYVAEAGHVYGDPSAPARILRVDGAGQIEVVADQLNPPITDLLWHDGRLYISHRGKISALSTSGAVEDLVTGLPSLGDHHNNQMTAGPDGKIYFGQGTATNSGVVGLDNFLFLWLPHYPQAHDVPARDLRLTGEKWTTLNPMILGTTEESKLAVTGAFQPFGKGAVDVARGEVKANGTILRMNPDGSALEVYAWGLRNPFGVVWGPDGRLYASENGYDERGSRPVANAPDHVWVIKEGAWYGFPDYVGGVPVTDERFAPAKGNKPKFLLREHPPVQTPLAALPVHAGVAKMEVGFDGQLYLAQFGDTMPITGQLKEHVVSQVVRIDPKTGQATPFFRTRPDAAGPKGLEYTATAGPRRMVDVRQSPDGRALYVVDLGAYMVLPLKVPLPQPFAGTGVVWRIVREGAPHAGIPPGLSAKPGAAREAR
jgi:glucose/arabinose dehydrogenase